MTRLLYSLLALLVSSTAFADWDYMPLAPSDDPLGFNMSSTNNALTVAYSKDLWYGWQERWLAAGYDPNTTNDSHYYRAFTSDDPGGGASVPWDITWESSGPAVQSITEKHYLGQTSSVLVTNSYTYTNVFNVYTNTLENAWIGTNFPATATYYHKELYDYIMGICKYSALDIPGGISGNFKISTLPTPALSTVAYWLEPYAADALIGTNGAFKTISFTNMFSDWPALIKPYNSVNSTGFWYNAGAAFHYQVYSYPESLWIWPKYTDNSGESIAGKVVSFASVNNSGTVFSASFAPIGGIPNQLPELILLASGTNSVNVQVKTFSPLAIRYPYETYYPHGDDDVYTFGTLTGTNDSLTVDAYYLNAPLTLVSSDTNYSVTLIYPTNATMTYIPALEREITDATFNGSYHYCRQFQNMKMPAGLHLDSNVVSTIYYWGTNAVEGGEASRSTLIADAYGTLAAYTNATNAVFVANRDPRVTTKASFIQKTFLLDNYVGGTNLYETNYDVSVVYNPTWVAGYSNTTTQTWSYVVQVTSGTNEPIPKTNMICFVENAVDVNTMSVATCMVGQTHVNFDADFYPTYFRSSSNVVSHTNGLKYLADFRLSNVTAPSNLVLSATNDIIAIDYVSPLADFQTMALTNAIVGDGTISTSQYWSVTDMDAVFRFAPYYNRP